MFGMHLTLDLYDCEKKLLKKKKYIYKILYELPDIISMKKILNPIVKFYKGNLNTFDKGGISGFTMIAESHISIHTYPFQKYVSMDVFSCKSFDASVILRYMKKKLNYKRVEKNIIYRGLKFR